MVSDDQNSKCFDYTADQEFKFNESDHSKFGADIDVQLSHKTQVDEALME